MASINKSPSSKSTKSSAPPQTISSSLSYSVGDLDLWMTDPCSELQSELSDLPSHLQDIYHSLTQLSDLYKKESGSGGSCAAKNCLSALLIQVNHLLDAHPMIHSSPILNSASSLINQISADKNNREVSAAIDNFASCITHSVTSYWFEGQKDILDGGMKGGVDDDSQVINDCNGKSKSVEYLSSNEGSRQESSLVEMHPGEHHSILQKIEKGVEMSLQRTQAWSKFNKELVNYVEKRNNLYGEFMRSLQKVARSTMENIKQDTNQPMHTLFMKALNKDIELCETGQFARNLIQSSLFVSPMNARRAEHDKIRKNWKNLWAKQIRKMQETESSLRKAKGVYLSRHADHEKLKEQLSRETEAFNQSWNGNARGNEAKMEKKRKQEDEALQKAIDAEATYKQCIQEANKNQEQLERTRLKVLSHMKQLIFESDKSLKKCTVDYLKLTASLIDPLPLSLNQLINLSSSYKPGSEYLDYLATLNEDHHRLSSYKHFTFEPFNHYTKSTDAPKYETIYPYAGDSNHLYPPLEDTDSLSADSSISNTSSPGASPLTSSKNRKKVQDFLNDTEHALQDHFFKGVLLSTASKTHNFKRLKAPSRCLECNSYVYFNGAECEKCGLASHRKCLEVLRTPCGDHSCNHHLLLLSVPPLITTCIQHIEKSGLLIKGLYRLSSVKSKVESVCQDFDSSEPVDLSNENPNVLANVLKLYLRKLPNPLLTFKLYSTFIDIAKQAEEGTEETRERLKVALRSLPGGHYDTCAVLFTHLYKVAGHSEANQMNECNLGIVFGPTLLRSKDSVSMANLLDTPFQCRCVELILCHAQYLFDIKETHKLPTLSRSLSERVENASSPFREKDAPKSPKTPPTTTLSTEADSKGMQTTTSVGNLSTSATSKPKALSIAVAKGEFFSSPPAASGLQRKYFPPASGSTISTPATIKSVSPSPPPPIKSISSLSPANTTLPTSTPLSRTSPSATISLYSTSQQANSKQVPQKPPPPKTKNDADNTPHASNQ